MYSRGFVDVKCKCSRERATKERLRSLFVKMYYMFIASNTRLNVELYCADTVAYFPSSYYDCRLDESKRQNRVVHCEKEVEGSCHTTCLSLTVVPPTMTLVRVSTVC